MIGNVIKAIRIANDQTISGFSGSLELSQPYISDVEKGNKGISLERLKQISKLYHISIRKIKELDKLDDEQKLSYMEMLREILNYYLSKNNKVSDCHQKVKK